MTSAGVPPVVGRYRRCTTRVPATAWSAPFSIAMPATSSTCPPSPTSSRRMSISTVTSGSAVMAPSSVNTTLPPRRCSTSCARTRPSISSSGAAQRSVSAMASRWSTIRFDDLRSVQVPGDTWASKLDGVKWCRAHAALLGGERIEGRWRRGAAAGIPPLPARTASKTRPLIARPPASTRAPG